MLEFLQDLDGAFWIKFFLVGFVIVILPVWIFNFIEISFLYKILYTLAGGVGLWLALRGKTIGRRH